MKREILESLLAARTGQRAVALATDLETGAESLVFDDRAAGDLDLDADALAAVRAAVRADRATTLETGAKGIFVNVFNPPLRLVVVGAVHIAQALVPMAALAGYAVTVVDPRRAFATDERFPGVTISEDWPDEALDRLAPDARTAVVTLTHDPKLDDPALIVALASPAFYIGALGSTRTHAKRLERLAAEGVEPSAFARIHGPAGLPLGARSPAEIAVSIVAQMTQALRQADDA